MNWTWPIAPAHEPLSLANSMYGERSTPSMVVRTIREYQVGAFVKRPALLRAAHAGLNASLLILKQSPGPARAQTASVRLMQAKSRSNKTPKR